MIGEVILWTGKLFQASMIFALYEEFNNFIEVARIP